MATTLTGFQNLQDGLKRDAGVWKLGAFYLGRPFDLNEKKPRGIKAAWK